MANPNPAPHRRFKPGQSGNPKGNALPPVVKTIRHLTHAHIAEIGTLILNGDVPALREVVQSIKSPDPGVSKKYTAMQVWFATCALKAIAKGDVYALNAFLDRVVGRVRQEIEVTGSNGGPILLAHMTDEDIEARYRELKQKMLEEE